MYELITITTVLYRALAESREVNILEMKCLKCMVRATRTNSVRNDEPNCRHGIILEWVRTHYDAVGTPVVETSGVQHHFIPVGKGKVFYGREPHSVESMAGNLAVENLLPKNVGSIIHYLQ